MGINSRAKAQRLRRKKEFLAKLKKHFNGQQFNSESIGHHSQDTTSINLMPANLPDIKVEQTEMDYTLDKSSRTEDFSENFIRNEIENSLIFKYKLTKCSVLLHDCLIPENLTSILEKYKFLRINTDISETLPKVNLFPLSKSPFLPHASETYEKITFPGAWEKILSPNDRRLKPNHELRKKISTKNICNCFKAVRDEMISMGMENDFYENYSQSTQQCSCLRSDFMLSQSSEMLIKNASLFDPDFGKITCSINKID